MTLGLINVVPKDQEGKEVSDMKKAIIDINEEEEGVREGKEWLAMIGFLSSMKDLNDNGIPDVDSKYLLPVRCFLTVRDK